MSDLVVGPFAGLPAEWNDFARRQPGSTLCHEHAWCSVITDAFGHECHWLAARDRAGGLRGILPLVRVRSVVFGDYLVSMPFLNYGGPLGEGDAVAALAAAAVEMAKRLRVDLLELRSRVELPLELAVSHRKITVVLDLPSSSEALMQSFPAKLRSQIRRPAREGLSVRFGVDQLKPFYSVFSRHMHHLGTPVLPFKFFETMTAALPGIWIGCGYFGEEPVTCGAGFGWNHEFEMTWASSLAGHNRTAPNMGLYWAFLARSIEAGFTRFNFGRCTPNGGTHRFKQQWGGRDEPLWWYQYPADGGARATPSPDSGAFAWGPRLWRRLPLGLANRLGPHIVRSIP